ncbi:hypothetical protein POM88_046812 [Heracleum sosnowskyi]|uniref:Endonuclease/exonuclease/phosphatase domain-containing protein n=1 Tax=Heracleum sosnowskyi TaxID=360622 RepID=A0AAD8H9V5_9APIA|nr:hypothetical protein POM88_046812 [Heracleum sosnowskyi]
MGGQIFSKLKCKNYWNFVNHLGLIDMGFLGPRFTWTKGGTSQLQGRLGHALCNNHWRSMYSEATVTHLPRTTLDHRLLLIQVSAAESTISDLSCHRLQAAWFLHPSLKETICKYWENCEGTSLDHKLNTIMQVANKWNKSTFGNIFSRKKKTNCVTK